MAVLIVTAVLFARSNIEKNARIHLKWARLLPLLVFSLTLVSPQASLAAPPPISEGILSQALFFFQKVFSPALGRNDTSLSSIQKGSVVSAHMQASQSGKNKLTIYYRALNNIALDDDQNATSTPNCPSGWTEAVRGYGPHYLAIYAFDWSGGGWGGSWWWPYAWPPADPGGSYKPKKNPGDDEPPPPPPPGGGGGPTTPGGGYYPGEDVPPPFPGPVGEDGEPLDGSDPWDKGPDPSWGPEGPRPWTPWSNPNGDPEGNKPGGPSWKEGGGSLINGKQFSFMKRAVAQQPYSYSISDIDITSTSVCSSEDQMVVATNQFYQGSYQNASTSFFADACYGVHCNRCLICIK